MCPATNLPVPATRPAQACSDLRRENGPPDRFLIRLTPALSTTILSITLAKKPNKLIQNNLTIRPSVDTLPGGQRQDHPHPRPVRVG